MRPSLSSFCFRLSFAVIVMAVLAGCGARGGRFSEHPGEGPVITEGGVIFRYFDPEIQKIHLVGDFNNWSPMSDPMSDKEGNGEWTLFYPLAPGKYEYKFVIDGVYWIPDPENPNSVPDGFEGRNSVVIVPNILPPKRAE